LVSFVFFSYQKSIISSVIIHQYQRSWERETVQLIFTWLN
jgi:hypothetical protein